REKKIVSYSCVYLERR
ncbi:putative divalent cation-dependent regulator A, partial [Chlamydia psittaci 06-1683]